MAVVKLNRNKDHELPMWIISYFQLIIPLISSSFFGQILYALLTIFYCDYHTNSAFFSEEEECLQGIWFTIESILCVISIICLFFIAYVTNSIFYNPMCLKARNKKIHSLNDVIFLFTKIILNVLFISLKNVKDTYPLLISCNLITGINYYCLSVYQGYFNKNYAFVNVYLSLVLFWSFICLFLGKIFNSLFDFNGSMYLLVIGMVLLFLKSYYQSKLKVELHEIDREKISSHIEYYKYILELQNLIERKNYSRENKIALNSFLLRVEENCTLNYCFLKKYLNSLEEGFDLDILLYFYMQKIFEYGINKFNNDITLTISYIYFLLKRLGKKKKAIQLFKSINKNIYSLDKLFNIYRCEIVMDNLWTGFDGKNKENIESADIIKLFDYQNNVKQFKDLLNKISLLYYDFWLALFSNNCEGKEQFKKLNDIGTKINNLLGQVDHYFDLIYSIKNDDAEILKLYSSYLKNILNNEEKYIEYHRKLTSISTDFNFHTNEMDYASYDINNLMKERKDQEFLIISAEDKEMEERKILNMSTGLSSIIGYQLSEIKGKDINILIPRLFYKVHNSMLKKLINKRKLELYKSLSNNLKYHPEITSKTVYCKTKSNFLKPLEFNAYLVQTEDGKHIYILLINRQNSFPTTWNEEAEPPACCVLTDKNFIIQTFTADCCDLLGFNSSVINSNFEITSCILQFNDDVINNFQENSNYRGGNSTYLFEYSDVLSNSTHGPGGHLKKAEKKNQKNLITVSSISRNNSSNKINNLLRPFHHPSDKLNLIKNRFKRHLIKTKYNSTQLITWKIKENLNESKSNDNDYIESKFELSVKECKISNYVVGYYFLFKKAKIMELKKVDSLEKINYYKEYVSNTIDEEGSIDPKAKDVKNSNNNSSHLSNNSKKLMNKSNTEYANTKSGFYLSQQILNKGKEVENQKSKEETKNNANSNVKKISGVTEEESNNFSFYLISGVKDETPGIDNKVEKEISLYGQILEREREREKEKEIESRRFHKIEGNFVPKSNISFDLDFDSKSFIPKKEIKSGDKKKDNALVASLVSHYNKQLLELKEMAKKKDKNSDDKSYEGSSYYGESSESGDSSYVSENTENEGEKSNNKEKNKDIESKDLKENGVAKKKTIKVTKEINDYAINSPKLSEPKNSIYSYKENKAANNQGTHNEFYRVKFDKIRLFQFDFIKDMVVEDKEYEKISKVDTIIETSKKTNYISDKPNAIFLYNKEFNFSNTIHKNEAKLKARIENKHTSLKKDKNIFEEKKLSNMADNEAEFKKRIQESLNKEDKQKSIEVFLIVSIIIFAALMAIGALSYYYVILQVNENKKNITLICLSAKLRTLFNNVIYFFREITLVNFIVPNVKNMVQYIKYPLHQEKIEAYRNFIKGKLENLYVETNEIIDNLNSFEITMSENSTYYLKEKPLIMSFITKNLNIYTINTTFLISLIEVNAALFNLIAKQSNITQNDTDIYLFIHNYQNEVGDGVKNQMEIYKYELNERVKGTKLEFIIAMIIIFILLVIFFLILFFSYRIIIKKKSSYIEGFYEIKLPFIRDSLRNCEQFIYLLKKQKREDEIGIDHERSSDNEENIEEELEEVKSQPHNTLNKSLSDSYYKNNKKNLSNQNNNRDTESIIIFSILLIICLLITVAFYIVIYYSYNNFTNNLSIYSTFMFHLQRIQNYKIELFNGYREYLFDNNSIISGMSSEDFIQNIIEEIFSTSGNDSYITNTMYNKIKNYAKQYEDFHNQKLCSRREEGYFDNESHCDNFLDGQIKYGYEITSYALLDLTRMAFNYVKYYYLDYENITGNLTKFRNYEDIKDNETFRLEIFNDKTTHSDLNVIFLHTLLPYYTGIVNITYNAILEAIEDSNQIYLILMIGYFTLNVILFLVVWIPFIRNMNSIIYNAKKILGIIPINILSTLSNIKNILDIKKFN